MAEGDNYRERRAPAKRFLGSPCARGHDGWRYVLGRHCVQCVSDDSKRRTAKSPEHKALLNKRWQEANAERIAAYKEKHKERDAAVARRYREKHRDRIAARIKTYVSANLEKYRAHARRRYAAKMAASGSHTAEDVEAIRVIQKNRCAYCRSRLSKGGGEIDHILPLTKGGSNDRKNLQLLCVSCNRSKGARHPIEHARRLGLLL